MARKRTKAQRDADRLRSGRPPKPQAERLSEQVMVYMTSVERQRLEEIARREKVSVSSLLMRPWRKEKDN
jgi:hypothetical protein